jgi:hypothetical protein
LDGGASEDQQNGQVLIAALTIALLVLLLSVALISFAAVSYRFVKQAQLASEAMAITEAGIDHAIRQLNLDAFYAGETDTAFGNGVFTVTVMGTGNERTIESTGSIPDSTSPRAQRTIRVKAGISTTDVEFFYGIQVDDGGLYMNNNARVVGNIFSNGSITGGNGATITGDAIVAGGGSPELDQTWDQGTGAQPFGDAASRVDAAQQFTAGQNGLLVRVTVRIRYIDEAENSINVRIVTDNNNRPSRTVLGSGTISSSSIGSNFSWINISISPAPTISAGTKYWVILDLPGADGEEYYEWQEDSGNGYTGGKGMLSPNWNTGNPTWTEAGGDLHFQTWVASSVTMIDNVDVNGTARANTLKDIAVGGDAYYQTIINSTVAGQQFPGSPDEPRQELPISDGVIADWKSDAAAGGTHSGDYILTNGASASLGPRRITGKLIIDNLATLIMTGTLWVEGNVELSNNCTIRLDAGYGNNSGIIVTDGKVVVSNNCTFQGSGNPSSYIMLLSAKNSPSEEIMTIDNNSVGVIYYSGKGRIKFSNNAQAKEATAYGITMDNNAVVTYEAGLANVKFASGPGGGWSVVVGSWQEIK